MDNSFDLARIRALPFLAGLEYCREIDSTNNRALERAKQPHLPCPWLVLTDRQTKGRGRGTNQWWSGAGSLTFSLVLECRGKRLLSQAECRISLVAALSVCETVQDLLPHALVQLKWPNDVFFQGKKLCGILVEADSSRGGRFVVGIGVNVNNSLRAAPVELSAIAISLTEVAEQSIDRTDVLLRILTHFSENLTHCESNSLALADRWRSLCMLHGRTLCVEAGKQRTIGVCQGIDDEGALLLQTEAGISRCLSGMVVQIY